MSPTKSPTTSPTASPTQSPTTSPTASPTTSPTASPTESPTTSPTASPTKSPTTSPTASPTVSPTVSPTKSPTTSPTVSPTTSPTPAPTEECRVTVNETVQITCFNDTVDLKFTMDLESIRPVSVLFLEVTDATLSMDEVQSFSLPDGNTVDHMVTMTNVTKMEHYFYTLNVVTNGQHSGCWINKPSKTHILNEECPP